jgi:addiction module RelB/DinJ family antitoxin
MKTAIVTAKIDPSLKSQAERVARELGVSLSFVINNGLREFVEQKELILIPNRETVRAIKQAERDYKAGRLGEPKDPETFLKDLRKLRKDL